MTSLGMTRIGLRIEPITEHTRCYTTEHLTKSCARAKTLLFVLVLVSLLFPGCVVLKGVAAATGTKKSTIAAQYCRSS